MIHVLFVCSLIIRRLEVHGYIELYH